jgi:hypothetical protein
MAAPRYISSFAAPTEYERQAAEARRRQALAEALEAQAYQPLSGSAAPTPSAAPLVMALQSFLSARQRRKAEEAGEQATQMEQEFGRRIAGRLEGGYVPPSKEEAARVFKEGQRTAEQIMAATPVETTLQEVTPTAQYRKAPQEALSMAMTPLGMGAMKRAPLLATALEKSMEKPKVPDVYGQINPKDYTEDSIKAFNRTVQSGTPDYSVLKPFEKPEDKGLKVGSISPSDFTRESIAAATAANDIKLLVPVPKAVDPAAADRGRIRLEDQYRREFDTAIKSDIEELSQIGKVKTILGSVPAGGKPNAIQQDVLVTLLMKFIEPGSVVREGEYDRLVSRQGLVARAQTLLNKIQTGEPLTGEALNQISQLANLFNEAATNRVRKKAGQISTLATNRGLDIGNIVLDQSYLQKPLEIGSSLSGKPTQGSGWTPELEAELKALEAKQRGGR